MLGYKIVEVETEQWLGSEWAVEKDGKRVYEIGADEGVMFPRLRCRIWVLLHVLRLV